MNYPTIGEEVTVEISDISPDNPGIYASLITYEGIKGLITKSNFGRTRSIRAGSLKRARVLSIDKENNSVELTLKTNYGYVNPII